MKSGKISGVIAEGTTVVIKNKDTAWTTKTDENGKFTVYVPAGSYDIIVDSATGMKNNKYSIKVQAGQNNLPFDDLQVNTVVDDTLGFELGNDKASKPSVNPESKEYKGKAVQNSTVRAYTVDDKGNVDLYTLIGETVTKKATASSTIGEFSIKLKEAQPGKKIKLVVEDEALNSYSPIGELFDKALDKIDPVLAADSKAQVGKDVNIAFADKSGSLVTSIDLVVTLKEGTNNPITLTKMIKGTDGKTTGDYKITSGKITISNQTILTNISDFTKDTVFDITVKASGFKDSSVEQTVLAVSAPSLTASVAKATNEGVKLTASTKVSGNTIKYKISADSIETPKLYSTVNDATTLTASPTDNIIGVDATTNKYLAVYELDKDSKVIKFKQILLTKNNIQVVAADAP
nr:carboxypeptidase regulatory-like domain-containing protein [Bacillus sp. FJAT-29790]